ncbi:MutS-related protein, family 1 [Geofilum rubicundum JCM 15548]|uniref:MutS-related protein, family 1 n=1 Tax=Geofilum rubicundum JCM 15548 TaxID=1236989 RepID=A0A0E9M306_9BACT|nr:MutS-related protein, family 1 [Geofilum rubicundum JCM 15548]
MDAIHGLARFAMNNREQVSYPEVSEKGFVFEAIQMGHPLIPADTRVCNDVSFTGQPKVMVVTGANMAGKSTFLRTLAVNLLLAMNGAPVVARFFRFSPVHIMSSINIRDSLSHKASYFYSELLRIREIIDYVKACPQTLVVLDEILRGTNTKDKQAGSLGLLEKLMAMKATVVIATHDLTIGELDKKHPEIVINHCFEVELEGDQLVFDYQLKKGVSQKLNASFLMRQMGVID